MSWGIADTAPNIEEIQAESADYLNGLNSCGVIEYSAYSNAFDFYADLLDKAYEQGQKDAERKPGRWLLRGKCSLCGGHAPFWSMASTYYKSNYCPNCGAKMEANDG